MGIHDRTPRLHGYPKGARTNRNSDFTGKALIVVRAGFAFGSG